MTQPNTCAVFYDGSCPLCSAEIAIYRDQDSAGALSWVDVSQPASLPHGMTQAAAMARFHVMTPEGQVLSGAAAFVRVWRALPRWRWLARLSDLPGMVWVIDRTYDGFLKIRPFTQALFARLRGTTPKGRKT